MEAYIFSFVTPYLAAAIAVGLLLRLAGMEMSRRPGKVLALGMPLIFILVPVKQVPMARFLAGFNLDFSITLTALLFCLLLRQVQGVRLLDRKALRTLGISGLVLGLCLYVCSMNLVPFDLYRFGWGSAFLLAPLFSLTILLILTGNRAGFVIAACVAAYALKLLESDNLWDYLVDPVLVIWCLVTSAAGFFSLVRSFFSPGAARIKA
jgi:hypothetical protein